MDTLRFSLPEEPFRILKKTSVKFNLIPDDVARIFFEKHLINSKDFSSEIGGYLKEDDVKLSLSFGVTQSLLARDWDSPEEDEIWAHL